MNNEIKVFATTEDDIVLQVGANVPAETEQAVIESFLAKGYEEAAISGDEEIIAESSILVKTGDFDGPGDSPYSKKAMFAHQRKLREMDRTAARRVPKPVPQPSFAPAKPEEKPKAPLSPHAQAATASITPKQYIRIPDTKKADLTPKAPESMDEKQREGMTAWARTPKHKNILDTNNGRYNQPETLKFESNGQWSLDKSNYGPKGGGQYTPADNVRRKANNSQKLNGLGNMGQEKEWGPGDPRNLDRQISHYKKLSRRQPVRNKDTDPKIAEEIKRRNAELAAQATAAEASKPLKKSWVAHGEIPAVKDCPKEEPQKAEALMADQLKNLLLNKSVIGFAPPPQPTDEEMFGRFAVTQEQADAAESKWQGTFNNFFEQAKKPVESQSLNKTWGSRGPITQESLTEEEERIRQIPVDPSLTERD